MGNGWNATLNSPFFVVFVILGVVKEYDLTGMQKGSAPVVLREEGPFQEVTRSSAVLVPSVQF